MRYLFEIAYDGSNYHGWQRQENAITVQEVVEEALTTICQETISVTGSGRTDTGVHCRQQFFHADIDKKIKPQKLMFRLNSYLPADIAIYAIKKIKPEAHARFDATQRAYEYYITTLKSPFKTGYTYYFSKPLDIKTMNEAAALLEGEKDFQAFSKVKTEVNNFICNITQAEWRQEGELITFHISANRFLRGMVRAIVGTLLEVGQHKLSVKEFKQVMDSKDRRKAGAAAPAAGLFLTAVEYPTDIFE
ncbi:MAG: tRNA pseudouridine(38-40) synthase TruA [Fulvivirga sp.]|nr:tRNA pseudouridine(38-40) synthase TruA [Fulvivirga sp.]